MGHSSDDSDHPPNVLTIQSDGTVDRRAEQISNPAVERPAELPLTRTSRRSSKTIVGGFRDEAPPTIRPTRWTEQMLEALEPHEHDFQEFKSSGWILRSPRELQPDFMYYLSKQVSAFVNGSGGLLFIGLNDDGRVDGGVPTDLKGGGTRAWLEDLVSACVDPPIPRCNIFEVGPATQENSKIKEGHAVFVVELPASQEAPHQAKDHRYYLRIAGKSRPMGHLHIQDVLRRTFHPNVGLSRFGPYGDAEFDVDDPRGPRAFIQFRGFVTNRGRTLARHVGLEFDIPRPFAGREVRRRMMEKGEAHYTQSPGRLTYFHYHPSPLFPSQEIYGMSVWVCIHGRNLVHVDANAGVNWTIYADDANPMHGSSRLGQFQVIQRAAAWVRRQGQSSP
ncbi:MAG: ATP-binding protein [Myxococcota bacterium]|nr:ATP-binding protein [Myxococcota bacterium]